MRAAVTRLRRFHEELRAIRVLDPACGSGNFLYMALAALKRVGFEVVREVEAITGNPELQIEEVDPRQFHGLEIKPWAREITELTLWIGHHQWWRQTHGHAQPPEPILKDTGTLECRDAVLAHDGLREDPDARVPIRPRGSGARSRGSWFRILSGRFRTSSTSTRGRHRGPSRITSSATRPTWGTSGCGRHSGAAFRPLFRRAILPAQAHPETDRMLRGSRAPY